VCFYDGKEVVPLPGAVKNGIGNGHITRKTRYEKDRWVLEWRFLRIPGVDEGYKHMAAMRCGVIGESGARRHAEDSKFVRQGASAVGEIRFRALTLRNSRPIRPELR